MKKCKRCKTQLPKTNFSENLSRRDKLNSVCDECSPFYARKARDHPDRVAYRIAQAKAWQEANPERTKETAARYRDRRRDLISRQHKKWRDANPDKRGAMASRQRATKIKRTPKWLTEDDQKWIAWHYGHSKVMEQLTGIKHHVDHIHPLQGETVCGLHVPWNLQVITARENLQKSNKF